MVNIILDDNFTIRVTKLVDDKQYDFSELQFYIPNTFNDSYICVYIIGDNKIAEIIPLQFVSNYNSYKIYKISYNNKIRISSGKISLKIIVISDNICTQSVNSVDLQIIVDSYNISHKLLVMKEFEKYIQTMYEKILNLTNLNIKISEDLLKGSDNV